MAAKNAFALLRLQDGEEPEKALEQNVNKYKEELDQAKVRASKPKYDKVEKAEKPKARSDKPARKEGQQRENRRREDSGAPRKDGERAPRRDDASRPARRDDASRPHRERSEGKGTRAPRRDNDRKSATGKRGQDDKSREESKLNLGKASEAEAQAAADVESAEKEAEEDAAAEENAAPKEPEVKKLSLAEYKAQNQGLKAETRRVAANEQAAFKVGDAIKNTDDVTIVDASSVAANAKARKGAKKAKEAPKKVDLKVNFYQHDREDDKRKPRADHADRPARRQASKGDNQDSRTPDFKNDDAFPALG